MAQHKSAIKRIGQNAKRQARNASRTSRIKTFIKKVEAAIESKNTAEAASAFRVAESEIMKAAGKGVLHLNTAARKVSGLARRLKSIS